MLREYKRCKVELVDDLNTGIEIAFTELEVPMVREKKKEKFNRAKEKRTFRKEVEEYLER